MGRPTSRVSQRREFVSPRIERHWPGVAALCVRLQKLYRASGFIKFMKTKIILPVVLLTIIAILGGWLAYEIVLRHRAARGQMQFETAIFVQLYQNLDRGDVEAAKRR